MPHGAQAQSLTWPWGIGHCSLGSWCSLPCFCSVPFATTWRKSGRGSLAEIKPNSPMEPPGATFYAGWSLDFARLKMPSLETNSCSPKKETPFIFYTRPKLDIRVSGAPGPPVYGYDQHPSLYSSSISLLTKTHWRMSSCSPNGFDWRARHPMANTSCWLYYIKCPAVN